MYSLCDCLHVIQPLHLNLTSIQRPSYQHSPLYSYKSGNYLTWKKSQEGAREEIKEGDKQERKEKRKRREGGRREREGRKMIGEE